MALLTAGNKRSGVIGFLVYSPIGKPLKGAPTP